MTEYEAILMVLTRRREGFKQQLKALNWERIGTATITNLVALCAADKAIEYVQDGEQFGQPIGKFQGVEWKLANMTKQIEAACSPTLRQRTRFQRIELPILSRRQSRNFIQQRSVKVSSVRRSSYME